MDTMNLDTSTAPLPQKIIRTAPAHPTHRRALPDYNVIPTAHPFFPLKRLLDIVGALTILFLLSPFMVLLAFWIPLDSPGGVLYRQKRKGRYQRPFYIFKFRTMYQDAHHHRQRLSEKNEVDGIIFKIREDPRVTGLGRLLRKYSIDELPQLFNVLLGEMSLVGPRPISLEDFQQKQIDHPLYDRWLIERHMIRPGLTGLWQISGRNDLPFEKLMRLDLTYVGSVSLITDLGILWRTIGVVLNKKGAY